jgi:hypothetical protein
MYQNDWIWIFSILSQQFLETIYTITQMKTYNIHNTAKVWNQEYSNQRAVIIVKWAEFYRNYWGAILKVMLFLPWRVIPMK